MELFVIAIELKYNALQPPFNEEARAAAGFGPEWYLPLSSVILRWRDSSHLDDAHVHEEAGTPDIKLVPFNGDAEVQVQSFSDMVTGP